MHAQIGSKANHKLMVEENQAKTVQFFSNIEDVLFFTENFSQPIIIVPNIPNEVRYTLYPKKDESCEIVINCVDIANRELVRNWLVRLLPEKPEISHVHRIDCKVNTNTNIKYEFTNPLNSWITFNFESNNSDLLSVILNLI